jgi:hypothetical protein
MGLRCKKTSCPPTIHTSPSCGTRTTPIIVSTGGYRAAAGQAADAGIAETGRRSSVILPDLRKDREHGHRGTNGRIDKDVRRR